MQVWNQTSSPDQNCLRVILLPQKKTQWKISHGLSRLSIEFLAECWRLTSVNTSYANCLEFVILCSSRWLKIEVTARHKKSVFRGVAQGTMCPRLSGSKDCPVLTSDQALLFLQVGEGLERGFPTNSSPVPHGPGGQDGAWSQVAQYLWDAPTAKSWNEPDCW